MPESHRYFFIVRGGGQYYDDESGTLLRDDEAAFDYAASLIEELKSDGEYDVRDWVVTIKNDDGRVIFSIPFSRTMG